MSVLIAIALKSLLIGGLTLGLLHLMRKRSAAERSWVAHVGLLALMIMAFAPLALPSWNVEAPAMLGRTEAPAMSQPAAPQPAVTEMGSARIAAAMVPVRSEAAPAMAPHPAPAAQTLDPIAAVTAIYAVPAAALLFITFLALARLVALQARAEVLVDAHWLSALARAQRRMGFKHGTALLTSNELASPISWGLMRPVILLNSRAVEATDEAEAIIAHELAHVARLDWIKLLLARVATALFWFNPLVWLLAREAHQLREETADDTVLAADIADTDYAQLLVGVARHECPGLLLGAHGVAPSKSSLARRIARVLDVKSSRGPAARGFALGVLAGAVLVAAPLAALNLTPAAPKASKPSPSSRSAIAPRPSSSPQAAVVESDLPHIIAQGVSTSVSTAMAAVAPAATPTPAVRAVAADDLTGNKADGTIVTRSANGASVTVYAPDVQGRRKVVARAPNGATAVSYAYADGRREHQADGWLAQTKVGLTPEYIGAMRAAAPRLGRLDFGDFTQLRAIGVTPDFARGLVAAGFPSISADELVEARAVGVTGAYVSAMRAAGVQGDLDDFIELRAVGLDPGFAARVRASGIKVLKADDLVELKMLGTARAKISERAPQPGGGNPDANPEPDWDPDG
jgi:bla regulator protein BlaR1